jgi:hypothetical protein
MLSVVVRWCCAPSHGPDDGRFYDDAVASKFTTTTVPVESVLDGPLWVIPCFGRKKTSLVLDISRARKGCGAVGLRDNDDGMLSGAVRWRWAASHGLNDG